MKRLRNSFHRRVQISSIRTIIISAVVLSLLAPLPFLSYIPSSTYTLNAAKPIYCSECGRRITGKYIKANNQYYCSKSCFEKTLPKCSVCGKPARIKRGDGKYFCSNECMKKTWPICSCCHQHSKDGIKRGYKKIFLCKKCAAKPKCFACYMPADHEKLSDGRFICKKCFKTAVMTQEKAEKLTKQVRKDMRDKLAIFTDHEIVYKLVGKDELKKHLQHKNGDTELGLFRFEQTVETTTTTKALPGGETTKIKSEVKSKTYTIYFLFGIPENKFIEVAAHELAHDWMQEYYPNITDMKTKEGWAEFVASLVNKSYGRPEMNERMEKNRNKIYGDGYRMIKEYTQKHKIDGLLDLFKSLN